jgi:putative ribosome biogenesis GTPase RsgA
VTIRNALRRLGVTFVVGDRVKLTSNGARGFWSGTLGTIVTIESPKSIWIRWDGYEHDRRLLSPFSPSEIELL